MVVLLDEMVVYDFNTLNKIERVKTSPNHRGLYAMTAMKGDDTILAGMSTVEGEVRLG